MTVVPLILLVTTSQPLGSTGAQLSHDVLVRTRGDRVVFSPDGRTCIDRTDPVLSFKNGRLSVLETETGKTVFTLSDMEFGVKGVSFIERDSFLLATDRNTIEIWSIASKTLKHSIKLNQEISAVAASHRSAMIACAKENSDVVLLDVTSLAEVKNLWGHNAPVRATSFSADGRMVITGSDDKTARIWDVNTGRTTHTLEGHGRFVRAVVFAPNGKLAATGSLDGSVRLWDTETGKLIHFMPGKDPVHALAFSPDGQWLVSGGRAPDLNIWSVSSGSLVGAIRVRRPKGWEAFPINSLQFVKEGTAVAASGPTYLSISSFELPHSNK